jgi:alpha-mannosidase
MLPFSAVAGGTKERPMSAPPCTVHIVMQGHLDPVWLWPWPAGLDEALATCRTACDLLDAHADVVFTAGEAWRYQQIETADPDLFARIRRHVSAGRWEIAGGWWIQPDCNFPSAAGFERQIRLGRDYLLDRFGVFPEVAYNVDSFGHAATLPQFMRAAGQRFYVMMRPQEHEMPLPARLFRWRGFPDGPEVVTFRIAGSYNTPADAVGLDHLQRALTELPPGVTHTMCFAGVGDHGGGATAELVQWVREHAESTPGCRLVFSSPGRFFRAVAGLTERLPLVTGELQYHAVGCYSALRSFKAAVRRAEHLLDRAERLAAEEAATPEARRGFVTAWRQVCFNHFHDTLGGTAVPSAYPRQYDQVGRAAAFADECTEHAFRRRLRGLPDDPLQRIVLFNATDEPFAGHVEHEPWTQWRPWPRGWALLDEQGDPVPFQLLAAESVVGGAPRVLFPVSLPPMGLASVRIARDGGPLSVRPGVAVSLASLAADSDVAVSLGADPALAFPGGRRIAVPRLELLEDPTDTWSHGVDRYAETPAATPAWDAPAVADSGPCMAALVQEGRIGQSPLSLEWRVYADRPWVEARLRVLWCETQRLLKLTLPLPDSPPDRLDGIPGGHLCRPNSGRECPVHDWTLFAPGDPTDGLGVVAPDVYALDATPERARWTLLRSPLMAHHAPAPGRRLRRVVADHGEHTFRFYFRAGADTTPAALQRQALHAHRPPLVADLTRGMPRRWESGP